MCAVNAPIGKLQFANSTLVQFSSVYKYRCSGESLVDLALSFTDRSAYLDLAAVMCLVWFISLTHGRIDLLSLAPKFCSD